jgi:hypothetical protein
MQGFHLSVVVVDLEAVERVAEDLGAVLPLKKNTRKTLADKYA